MSKFSITSKANKVTLSFIVIGVLSLILRFFTDITPHHSNFWGDVLHNSVFFFGISLAALVFVAVFSIGYGGWHTVFRRIPEAISAYLPIGALTILVIGAAVFFHWTHIYHWADAEAVANDVLLQGKSGYLNTPFWLLRMVIFLGIFVICGVLLRKISSQEDNGFSLKLHQRHKVVSALFFMAFMVFGSMMSWDWLMSIDAHWYSTLFGWYVQASMWVSAIAMITLLVMYLKSLGYLEDVSTHHIHDLGKMCFAFSVFWTYLWFAQFLLIWYANIPEETAYFNFRFEHYKGLFFLNLAVNFLLPFGALMINDSKKRVGTLGFVAAMIILGHWLDFYLMVKPGIFQGLLHAPEFHDLMHGAAHGAEAASHGGEHVAGPSMSGLTFPGLLEFGIMLGYLGLFLQVVLRTLTKTGTKTIGNAYIDESKHHQV